MLGSGPRRSWFLRKLAAGTIALSAPLVPLTVGGNGAAHAQEATILLFDASNSMNSNFDGGHRIDAARQAISETVPRYDTQLDIGLVAFGSRQRQSCGDVDSLVAPGPGNASKLVIAANSIKAQGVSILAQAMQRAAADADYQRNPTSIIAIVDGADVKGCRINSCTVAEELQRQAKDLTVHVIAMAPKPADVPALECVASATGGTYVTVANDRQVRNALDLAFRAATAKVKSTVVATAAPAPRRKPRPPVDVANAPAPRLKPDPASPDADVPASDERGTTPSEPGAAPGDTDDTVSVFAPTRPAGTAPATTPPQAAPEPQGAETNGNQVVMAPTVRKATTDTSAKAAAPANGAGQGVQKPAAAPGTTVLYKRPTPAATKTQNAPKPRSKAPEPETPKTAEPEQAEPPSGASPVLTIVPASEAENTIAKAAPPAAQPPEPAKAAGTGAVRLTAMIVADAKPIPEGMMWQIFRQTDDGGRGPLATRSSDPTPVLKLPAGRYLIEGRFGNALRDMPVEIKADQETEAKLVLNVGGLQLVPAVAGAADPDADISNTIFAADDLTTPVVANATAGAVIYLSAGRYRIVSRYGNANSVAEDDIQVQRGKLTQAKINHRAAPVSFRLVGKAGGAPLPGASWVITDQTGRTIKRSDEATPTYVLVEGTYQITANQDGKTFAKSITVEQGVPATVEILAK